jgi:hypothetical protein
MALVGQTWASYGKFPPPVAPYSPNPLPSQNSTASIIFPLIGNCSYRNNYNEMRSNFRHTGIDIRAPKMTPIVAPFSGTFGNKIYSFWIYGANGLKCLGTHLNDDTPGTNDGKNQRDFMFAPNLKHGDTVVAGQLIGYVGNSGDATGPHLHFELYDGRAIRNPFQSLKTAQVLSEPRLKLDGDKPEVKQERFEVCLRNWVASTRTFYGVLVAKQFDTGRVIGSTKPSFVTFILPKNIVEEIDPAEWRTYQPASIYFSRVTGENIVTKVVAPGE